LRGKARKNNCRKIEKDNFSEDSPSRYAAASTKRLKRRLTILKITQKTPSKMITSPTSRAPQSPTQLSNLVYPVVALTAVISKNKKQVQSRMNILSNSKTTLRV
jgi:hypothetical protein